MDQSKRTIYIVAAFSLVVIVAAVYFLFIFQKSPKKIEPAPASEEVKQLADFELQKRPYVTLTPTSDGAEIIISIEQMAAFDRIEYELTYLADNPQVFDPEAQTRGAAGEKIQRGATGTDVNSKEAKYKKSILLGTASRGVRSPDRGITDGKLVMHLFIGETEYFSETPWNLVQIGMTVTTLTDAQNQFQLEVPALVKSYWAIVADTVGLPPNLDGLSPKDIVLPVHGIFSIAPEFKKPAPLSLKLAKDVKNPQLYSYNNTNSNWQKLESSYDARGKTISAAISNLATFVVVSSQ